MTAQALDARQIFLEAVEKHAPSHWPEFLDAACGGDAVLRERVEALLKAHGQYNQLLDGEGFVATIDQPLSERPGTQIGTYKLLQQIGEGGFGIVFMAEQVEPVRRRVALKVIKPGMDTRQVIARFEAERQALAVMDHPNIARVLDAGTTESGRPYFVMELVRGTPITQYCDENSLSIRERLELFASVCQAIQHAHTKGIIHRDIKPTNVLVTRQDGQPVVKVIDFGIAKAMGQQLTEKTLFTDFAQMIGTPLYMSPEQAELSSNDIDTRSDIYSLGVLLYELLTGSTPVSKEQLKQAAFDEIRRIIREDEAQKPSNRISTTEAAPSIAAQRHTEPAKLAKLVRGELDWIVMKALEKDRNRRYETANGFAADIQHYLNDEAVVACPPSARYRLRKFTRRHRVPLTVAAGFLLLLVAGAVVSTYQAITIWAEQEKTLAQKREANVQRDRAQRQRDRAVAAEQKALTEAHKSEQVAAFMTDMLQGVGPSFALGRDTAMLREILDNTTKRLDELKGQPEVEADLRMVLGNVYRELADYPRAEAMFRAALALRRELLGDKHEDVAQALVGLGEALSNQKQWGEAERLFSEALAMQRELLGEPHPTIGFTLFHLGMMCNRMHMYNHMQRSAEAENHLREALVNYGEHSSPGTLDQLAYSLTRQRKYEEAEPIAREAVALWRKQTPSGSPLLSIAIYNYGTLLSLQGKHTEAEPYYREALEMKRKQFPPNHPQTFWSLGSMARLLIASDRGDEAIPFIDECVQVGEKAAMQPSSALFDFRLRYFQKRQDAAGCRASSEMWERMNRTDAAFLYNAACFRGVTAAVLRETDRSPEAATIAAAEADRAMDWLRKAVDAGYTDAGHMKQDKDLDALREREDFKKLVAELEAKQK
jgi:serine/threonine protein kinase/tetratricopeptide (TPR) repeat protein